MNAATIYSNIIVYALLNQNIVRCLFNHTLLLQILKLCFLIVSLGLFRIAAEYMCEVRKTRATGTCVLIWVFS